MPRYIGHGSVTKTAAKAGWSASEHAHKHARSFAKRTNEQRASDEVNEQADRAFRSSVHVSSHAVKLLKFDMVVFTFICSIMNPNPDPKPPDSAHSQSACDLAAIRRSADLRSGSAPFTSITPIFLTLPFYLTINQCHMDDDMITEPSLATEPDNLTETFHGSTLSGSHDSRRTQEGFLVTGARLSGFIPTPIDTKRPLHSWTWKQG